MRLELKPWQLGDRSGLMAVMNGVDRRFLSDRLPFPYTEQDAESWLYRVAELDGRKGLYRAVVYDGAVTGMLSLEQKEDVCRLDGEISYCLLPAWEGKGIMSEATGRFCRLAFAQLGLLRITGQVYAEHQASRRVLEKNGFVLEGTLRRAIVKAGKIQDLCIYGKLNPEGCP